MRLWVDRRLLSLRSPLRSFVRAITTGVFIAGSSANAGGAPRPAPATRELPAGAHRVPVENLEGLLLMNARLVGAGGRDTVGVLVLDTGAGYLGLDAPLATWLGIADSARSTREPIGIAGRPLDRLELGPLQLDQVSPVLVFDADIIRRVSGRPALGIAGQRVFAGRALWIDYSKQEIVNLASPSRSPAQDDGVSRVAETDRDENGGTEGSRDGNSSVDQGPSSPGPQESKAVVLTPAAIESSRRVFGSLIGAAARPVRFRLVGDNKMLIRARIGHSDHDTDPITLVFDTGATKCVLFEPSFGQRFPSSKRWPSLKGIVAPTLLGSGVTRVAMAPSIELDAADGKNVVRRRDVDCAMLETDLARSIEAATGEPVAGLVGYSFFKAYRIGIDFTQRLLWFDPDPAYAETRRYEYSQVGLQLESDSTEVRVLGIAEGSPAAAAGINVGDQLISVDGRRVQPTEILAVTRSLEGRPGSRITLVLRRNGSDHTYQLVRRKLLR